MHNEEVVRKLENGQECRRYTTLNITVRMDHLFELRVCEYLSHESEGIWFLSVSHPQDLAMAASCL